MQSWMSLAPAWYWGALTVLLLGLEVLSGTAFFLWLSAAALAAVVAALATPDVSAQCIVFAIAAISCTLGWWRYRGALNFLGNSDDAVAASLNSRVARHIGETHVLTEAIVGSRGRIRIDDTLWLVSGNDMPAGTRISITGADSTVMRVEKKEE